MNHIASPRIRFRAAGAILAGAVAALMAVPALAQGTTAAQPAAAAPAACGATVPPTTPCTPAVINAGGVFTLTLPGVGSLVFTVDPATNEIVSASVSGVNVAFTAALGPVDEDAAAATFTKVADPTVAITISGHVSEPTVPAGAPAVTAVVTRAEKEDDKDDQKESNDKEKAEPKGGVHIEHHDQGGHGGQHEGHGDK